MISKLLQRLRQANNKKKISSLGLRSQISGSIDIRAVGAKIYIGDDCLIHGVLVTETGDSTIKIGNNVFLGGDTTIDCVVSVIIEDDVLISYGCLLADSDNHSVSYSLRKKDLQDWKSNGRHDWHTTASKPIHVSKGAWIGAKSIVLKGVRIGEGAVIGAGSVVTRDVPPYTIVAGNPARVIREIPPDER